MSVFDHGHALFGFHAGGGLQRMVELRDRLGVSGGTATMGSRHCLLDVLQGCDYFEGWLGRISALPDFFVRNLCHDAVGVGITSAEADGAMDFLKHRRDNLRLILDSNRLEFRGIAQWSLPL
jgi:hypothetical protein